MHVGPFRRKLTWAVVLTVMSLSGAFYAAQVYATTPVALEEEDDFDASLKTFTNVLSLVQQNNARDVNLEDAVYGAIEGMLRTLDPHSRFFTPEDFIQLREDQQGRYYGLGITVAMRLGRVTVVSKPFPNSPAEEAGLRVGDVISHVNGQPTSENLTEVVSRLKGPKGTPVEITIDRPGEDESFDLTVIRDEIEKHTINQAFEIRPGIGYIKIDNFAETTGAELRDSLRKLNGDSLRGLVLDLRGNPGGLLDEAIEVSETFLQRDQVIVETRGRTRNSNRAYASQRVNEDNLYPLVVIIDRNSASASEIVAGAVQDHDRGLIVGETSFGKGLVQSVFPLKKQGGLALTTQKWYTPSGRLIQRDYSEISEFDYYYQRGEDYEPSAEDVKYSDLGRVVYGGGGITPDVVVPARELNAFERRMTENFVIISFVREFLSDNPSIDLSFEVSPETLERFVAHALDREIAISSEEVAENEEFLSRSIKTEVFYNRIGVTEATQVSLEGDEQVLRALELVPEAESLAVEARAALAFREDDR